MIEEVKTCELSVRAMAERILTEVEKEGPLTIPSEELKFGIWLDFVRKLDHHVLSSIENETSDVLFRLAASKPDRDDFSKDDDRYSLHETMNDEISLRRSGKEVIRDLASLTIMLEIFTILQERQPVT